jgi:hypothetical protein
VPTGEVPRFQGSEEPLSLLIGFEGCCHRYDELDG